MATKRIGDVPAGNKEWYKAVEPRCYYPDHDPPQHIVLEPGMYEHTCEGCGKRQVFIVHGPSWGTKTGRWSCAQPNLNA